MALRLSTKLLLAGLLSTASLVAAREPYDQATEEADSTCNVCYPITPYLPHITLSFPVYP